MHLIKRQLKPAKKPRLKKSKKQATKAVHHLTRETEANVFALTHLRILTGALRGMRASLTALLATSSCFRRCAKGQRCRHGRSRCSACRPVAEMTRCMGKKAAMTIISLGSISLSRVAA